jgi:hypothetical protein
LGQERFVEGLQVVADRRRSIVFDGVSTALIRASEATGEVNDMLNRLADSTRQNVAAFEEALISQINARSNITWGTYGPWLIFTGFKFAATFFTVATGSFDLFGSANAYFSTPQGNILALFAAAITMGVNRHCNSIAQRGLVVRRIATTDAPASSQVARGQSSNQAPADVTRGSILTAQGRPASY